MSKDKENCEPLPPSSSQPLPNLGASVVVTTIGIWKILTLKEKLSFKPTEWISWQKYTSAIPTVYRFLWDVYSLDSKLVMLYLLGRAWGSIEPGITIYISGRLFLTIEAFLRGDHSNPNAVLQAVFAQILCVIVSTLRKHGERRITPKLASQTMMYFEESWFRENLRYDVQTLLYSKNYSGHSYISWQLFVGIIETCSGMLGFFTIVTSILYQHQGGPLFTIICLIYPLISRFGIASQFPAMVLYSDNTDYLRIQALRRLAEPDYREDIVIGNLSGYIIQEHTKARESLGHLAVEDPMTEFYSNLSPIFAVFQNLCGQLPVVYFALCAIIYPSRFSLSTLAILRQQSDILQSNVDMTISMLSNILRTLKMIQTLYTVEELKLVDGTTGYCAPKDNSGMSFELRNISFEYPGTKAKEGALKNVSLKIEPGQLVVVVGANGSGKSTFIKLLTRMYDVTSGEIIVDGLPIQDYKIADLHEATAILTQSHLIYPLSLSENIGLGYPDRVVDTEMIQDSARKGGADELVANLTEGLSTNLEPVKTAYCQNLELPKHEVLHDILEKLEVSTQLSGGEMQRIVASRTFMRLRSPKVKFVAVDEPSSAMDPRGELQLFDRLREEKAGKTMIFVTHRFGHLTRFADLIICMKNGQVAESGVHKDLMALKGEYATLYSIQAQAFASNVADEVVRPE